MLTLSGTAAITFLYQSQVNELRQQNENLEAENEQLRERIDERETQLRRAEEHTSEVRERMGTRLEDVEAITNTVRQLEQRLNKTQTALAKSQERTNKLESDLQSICNKDRNKGLEECEEYSS